MKFFVCVAVLLQAVQYAESYCYNAPPPTAGPDGLPIKTCTDKADGILHDDGESWLNSACHSCSCSSGWIHCCTTYSTPRNYPDDCVAVFDQPNCRYIVHKENDPSVECPVWMSVGK